MPAPVTPRPPAPPVVGLLASVTPVTEPDLRWAGAGGWSFTPAGCDVGGTNDPCDLAAEEIPDPQEPVEGNAFSIWSGSRCSVTDLGGRFEELLQEARDTLEATQSKRIARELWYGEEARAAGWSNQYLTSLDSDVVTDGGTSVTSALACLEQYLGDCSGGARGMIHASRQIVTRWSALGLVRREGGLTLTIHDTIVVPDAGYDGSGPQGAPNGPPTPPVEGSIWVYATSLVQVRLGPIGTTPTGAGDLVQAVDRDSNDYLFRSRRLAMVGWGGCCHGAAEVDAELCGIGGPGS